MVFTSASPPTVAISCPSLPKWGICPTPKRICTQQKTAVASHLAVQHFKMKNVILFMWIRVVCSLSLTLSLSLSSTTTLLLSSPPSSSLLVSIPFFSLFRNLLSSAFSLPLRGCTARTSARVQINFNFLIPFEKRVCGRLRGKKKKEN